MLYVKAWSWNNVNSLIKNVNCFTLLKPICACYLSHCVVFILENRQKFASEFTSKRRASTVIRKMSILVIVICAP